MNGSSSPAGSPVQQQPELTRFQPERSALPESIAPDTAPAEPLVILVGVASDPTWAADTAVAIAAAWSRSGRRLVLADLHLEHPVLHERVGVENEDGIVDIFLYGASVARSARPVSGHGFFFIPAGTYTASPEEVFEHPRWSRLVAGFKEAGATLLVYVPADAAGMASLGQWSQTAIVLGEPGSPWQEPIPETPVRAVLAPPLEEAERPGAAAPAESAWPPAPEPLQPVTSEEEQGPDGPETLPASASDWQRAAAPAGRHHEQEVEEAGTSSLKAKPEDLQRVQPAAAARGASADDPGHAPLEVSVVPRPLTSAASAIPGGRTEEDRHRSKRPVHGPRRRRRRFGPGPFIWVVAVAIALLALVLIAAALRPQLFDDLRRLYEGRGEQDGTTTVEPIPPAPEAPVPLGDTLTYTVRVREYTMLAPARVQAARQAQRVPDTQFYVVPEQSYGAVYFKVMAGMLSDSLAATELRERLVQLGVVNPRDMHDDPLDLLHLIQARPWAFLLGEFTGRERALARIDTLAAREILAYPVMLPYSDGTQRWRLYAGAFTDSLYAEELRHMLRAADLTAPLVVRVGHAANVTP